MDKMRSVVFCHKKNHLSFSYCKSSLTKENFTKYCDSKQREDYVPMVQHDPSVYLHVAKDGMYRFEFGTNDTFCSLDELKRTYHQSDDVYFFLMKNLNLNFFKLYYKTNVERIPTRIKYITSTFCPEDVYEINLEDYYKIYIKDKRDPLYVQKSSKLYDESGNRKPLVDLVHRMGKRRLLGLDLNHRIKTFDIERVQNILPEEDDSALTLEPPFYEIGIETETHDKEDSHPVLMDNILVHLD